MSFSFDEKFKLVQTVQWWRFINNEYKCRKHRKLQIHQFHVLGTVDCFIEDGVSHVLQERAGIIDQQSLNIYKIRVEALFWHERSQLYTVNIILLFSDFIIWSTRTVLSTSHTNLISTNSGVLLHNQTYQRSEVISKDHIYRMVIVEGRCTMARSSSLGANCSLVDTKV